MSANPPSFAVSTPELCPSRSSAVVGVGELSRQLLAYVLPAGTTLLYLLFPTRNYYWDGISFATSIEAAHGLNSTLIHPHHPLYNVFGYLLYSLAQTLGWQVRAVTLLQIANAVISGLCAVLVLRFLKRTLTNPWVASIGCAAFSFSACWWKYSTDADAYVPSVFFLLVCLNLLLAVERLRPLLLALAHTASMLMHQLAVFFFPAVVVGILLRSQYSLRQRFRMALQYAAGSTILTLGVNYYCFHWQTGGFTPGHFVRWLTMYVQGPHSYSFSFDLFANLAYTLRGQGRLFFAGRINWTKGLLSFPLLVLIAVLVAIVLVLSIELIRRLPKFRPQLKLFAVEDRFRSIVIVCLVWLASYLLFLFFWYPYFTPYRIYYLPPLIVLGSIYLYQRVGTENYGFRWRAAMFVMAMALSNFVFFILPLTHVEKFPPLAFALQMNRTWSRDSVVYYSESNADNQLLRYFNPKTDWRLLDVGDRSKLEQDLSQVYDAEATVWLETTAIDRIEAAADGRSWLAAHSMPDCGKELDDGSYRIKFVQVFPLSLAARFRSNCAEIAKLHESPFK